MNEAIMIQKVANGYVVTLPKSYPGQYEVMAGAFKTLMPGHDEKLTVSKDDNTDHLPELDNCYIFESMESILAFLAQKYIA